MAVADLRRTEIRIGATSSSLTQNHAGTSISKVVSLRIVVSSSSVEPSPLVSTSSRFNVLSTDGLYKPGQSRSDAWAELRENVKTAAVITDEVSISLILFIFTI
jgi:hypothetical protein